VVRTRGRGTGNSCFCSGASEFDSRETVGEGTSASLGLEGSRGGSECVCAVSKSGPFTKSIGCSRGRLIRVRTTADACSRIADDRAEWERAHPEDGKATVRGICTYCGEIIRESSTGPKAFEVLYEDFDELT
jgi:hypothetical protein